MQLVTLPHTYPHNASEDSPLHWPTLLPVCAPLSNLPLVFIVVFGKCNKQQWTLHSSFTSYLSARRALHSSAPLHSLLRSGKANFSSTSWSSSTAGTFNPASA